MLSGPVPMLARVARSKKKRSENLTAFTGIVTDPYPRIHHAKFRTAIQCIPTPPYLRLACQSVSFNHKPHKPVRQLTCNPRLVTLPADEASTPQDLNLKAHTHFTSLTGANKCSVRHTTTLQYPSAANSPSHNIPTYKHTEVGIAQLWLRYVVHDRRIVVRFLTVISRNSKMAPRPAQPPIPRARVGGGGFFWAEAGGWRRPLTSI